MSTKPGSMPASVLLIQTAEQIISKLVSHLFQKDYGNCLTGLQNIIVLKFVWNLLASTGFQFEKANVSVILSHPKYTKPQKGNKTDRKDANRICDLFMCDMVKPSFIPPADIRHLRDLVRYRFKLACMITGEKNRAQNCLTVSNLKLDDVFSDVFGKSSRSITEYILEHPGDLFDVTPFVDKRCKTPIEEIQAAVDGAISPEQAVKLRQCLNHIDELEKHLDEIEQEILRLSDKYQAALDLIRTVPGFDKNPMTAIQVLSEIGGDMSVFPSAKHLVS